MTQTRPSFLGLGEPRFTDPALQRMAQEQGPQAAWAQAFAGGAQAAMSKVAGEFGVALREPAGRCFLAVDHFATHPLCYRVDHDGLHFAERADVLATAGDDALDPQAIFNYLFFHMIPSPRTVYRGVFRLPAGHCAVYEGGKLTVTPYFTPRFTPEAGPDFSTRRDAFRGLLRQAVTRRLDGSKPACFLSGGTDSSTVAGLVTEISGKPAATYSIGFDAAGYDEMEYARIASRHFGTDHHEYYVTPDDLVSNIPAVARHFDQPFGNSSALPAFCCSRFAHGDGVTRLLAGDGGDELFGGNSRYAKQRLFGWYQSVPAPLRSALMEPLLLHTPLGKLPGFSKAASYVEQARVPMPDRNGMTNLLLNLGLGEVLTPAFLARVDSGMPLREQQAVWRTAQADNELDRELAYDWRFTLAENDLPKVCMTTRLAGPSVSFPFLDDDVLAFSMRLPPDWKLQGQKLRWFFKEALRGFLPDEIITKKKHGFGLPFGVWAIQHDGLRRLSTDSLQSLAQRGIVQPGFIRTLLDTKLREHPGYYGEMVWILMMLEQWLQGHAPGYRMA